MTSFPCNTDDFCLEHGTEYMRTRMGDPVPFCEKCEADKCPSDALGEHPIGQGLLRTQEIMRKTECCDWTAKEPCEDCPFPNPAAADSNASAEARLREDAERYRWLRDPKNDVSLVIDKRTLESCGWIYEYRAGEELDEAIDRALSPAPHASDCEKRGERTKSEALMSPEEKAALNEDRWKDVIPLEECSLPEEWEWEDHEFRRATGCPSDRPADVTEAAERLRVMADSHIVDPTPLNALGQFDATYGDLRALLRAFEVSRK